MEGIEARWGGGESVRVPDKRIADRAGRRPCRIPSICSSKAQPQGAIGLCSLLYYQGPDHSMHTWLRRNAVAPGVSRFGCGLQAERG
jgi:hypothetical protein